MNLTVKTTVIKFTWFAQVEITKFVKYFKQLKCPNKEVYILLS